MSGTEYGEKSYTDQLKHITIEHLPTHTAGGWDNKDNDPMFMQTDLNHADLINVECDLDIDVCDQCYGVWLATGELDALADGNNFTPRDFAADELHELKCPRCSTRNFATIQTQLGAFARCKDCGGVFVGGETLDCISKSDRSVLPSKQTADTVVMSADVLSGVVELLWLFSHH